MKMLPVGNGYGRRKNSVLEILNHAEQDFRHTGRRMSNVIQAKEDMGKSKEQLEEEKRAILNQRCGTCSTTGMKEEQLQEMAKELFGRIQKLLGENYDMEEKFKRQQYDMMELAERARQMNKGKKGKSTGGAPRQEGEELNKLSEKYTQAPPRVLLHSKYERMTDLRSYSQRKQLFSGPSKVGPAPRIEPTDPLVIERDEDDEEEVPAPAEQQQQVPVAEQNGKA